MIRTVCRTWRIILIGSGGQGLGRGGKILAEAAVLQGFNAAQSQTYGAHARGGFSQSGIIISSQEILFPLIEKPDLLVVLAEKTYNLITDFLHPDTILIYDKDYASCFTSQKAKNNAYGFQMVKKARETFDERGVAVLALGILVGFWIPVQQDSILTAIDNNFSGTSALKNRQCFQKGLQIVRQCHPTPMKITKFEDEN